MEFDLVIEFFGLLSVLSLLYVLAVAHILVFNLNVIALQKCLSLFTLFFLTHITSSIFIHFYIGANNPIPYWQWGGISGGDEINFFNYMQFFFDRFNEGNYGFDYVDEHSKDFSIWIYILAFVSHLMPISEATAYFTPKLVSSVFVSLTCFYTVVFARKILPKLRVRYLVLFLLLTPDFHFMAGGLFRGSMTAYCFIMVLCLLKPEHNHFNFKETIVHLPVATLFLFWLIPNLKIFLNLLLIAIVIACLAYKVRLIFVSLSLLVLSLMAVNLELLVELIELFSHDSYGSLARHFTSVDTSIDSSSLGQSLQQSSIVLSALTNLLQFFITVPFWSPITSLPGEARAPIETLVILSSHLCMSLFLPGLLAVRMHSPKDFVWLVLPIVFYSLAMSLTGSVLFRWRFPIMGLIVVIFSMGFQAHYPKMKITYFIVLGAIYGLYLFLKGLV